MGKRNCTNCLYCYDSGDDSICRKCVWFSDDNKELFWKSEYIEAEEESIFSDDWIHDPDMGDRS